MENLCIFFTDETTIPNSESLDLSLLFHNHSGSLSSINLRQKNKRCFHPIRQNSLLGLYDIPIILFCFPMTQEDRLLNSSKDY